MEHSVAAKILCGKLVFVRRVVGVGHERNFQHILFASDFRAADALRMRAVARKRACERASEIMITRVQNAFRREIAVCEILNRVVDFRGLALACGKRQQERIRIGYNLLQALPTQERRRASYGKFVGNRARRDKLDALV